MPRERTGPCRHHHAGRPLAVPALLEFSRAGRTASSRYSSPPIRSLRGSLLPSAAGRRLRPLNFARYGLRYLRAKLLGPPAAHVAARFGIPTEAVPDVNAPEFLQRLRGLGIDLVISVACPQIFQRELLEHH